MSRLGEQSALQEYSKASWRLSYINKGSMIFNHTIKSMLMIVPERHTHEQTHTESHEKQHRSVESTDTCYTRFG